MNLIILNLRKKKQLFWLGSNLTTSCAIEKSVQENIKTHYPDREFFFVVFTLEPSRFLKVVEKQLVAKKILSKKTINIITKINNCHFYDRFNGGKVQCFITPLKLMDHPFRFSYRFFFFLLNLRILTATTAFGSLPVFLKEKFNIIKI